MRTERVFNVNDDSTVRSPSDERCDVVGQGGPEPSEVDGEDIPSHKRLFTPVELNLLWKGSTIGAEEEPEEYYKKLEERLYPLDEVELKRQMKKNTERLKTMALEEMSMLLKIPVEPLTVNREASPCELATPEYWLAWYKKTRRRDVPTVISRRIDLKKLCQLALCLLSSSRTVTLTAELTLLLMSFSRPYDLFQYVHSKLLTLTPCGRILVWTWKRTCL
ncbi:hypothetical protein PHMEG_00035025 [Phytophthora megakarya]|uniref:Uncharacterized protein n=1 Tax=Phytophthora megakarya TaxID=4795 RepID=A0A225UPN6_9STRA|nr:hypothetical protein PHMEG_00035025 [Phytophthora megakarya]